MPKDWTPDSVLEMTRSFQPAAVVMAAAELDVFSPLAQGQMTSEMLADAIGADRRATGVLADALVALAFLEKKGNAYSLVADLSEFLTEGGPLSILPMLRHQANIIRSWAQLAAVVRKGSPVGDQTSICGEEADLASFIKAMEVASRSAAPRLVASLMPLSFRHLLDVGAGPGTWAIAFLRAVPGARATLYDLPEVIPIAVQEIESAGLTDRVDFVGGSFLTDETLPAGADLAWVSAIIHMNSREENRRLFAKLHAALVAGGEIVIRDIVMDDSHTSPPGGALFAINMLVRTEEGGAFSLAELREDLMRSGFGEPTLKRGERDMDSIVRAARV